MFLNAVEYGRGFKRAIWQHLRYRVDGGGWVFPHQASSEARTMAVYNHRIVGFG